MVSTQRRKKSLQLVLCLVAGRGRGNINNGSGVGDDRCGFQSKPQADLENDINTGSVSPRSLISIGFSKAIDVFMRVYLTRVYGL